MSKVRREKHQLLVLYQKMRKQVVINGGTRWRQKAKARYEYVIKELKNE